MRQRIFRTLTLATVVVFPIVSGCGPSEPDPAAAVVVAHPDDEILWLGSALGVAGRVVFCFGAPFGRPHLAKARARAVAALPLAGLVSLALPESGARFAADWAHPQPTAAGIAITAAAARERYEANFSRLVNALRPHLAGMREVYTHNPWGEYGHTERIQVHRAVAALQAEFGYTMWVSSYVGARAWPLAQQLGRLACWGERRRLPVEAARLRALMRLYRRSGAWTWRRWHRWPAEETLFACPAPQRPEAERRPLSWESLLDVAALRPWPWPRPPLRRLS
jgi:hypothetical protein